MMNTTTGRDILPQLPPELWTNVCKLLEPRELIKYMGIHRVFYNEAMDMRYRELELRDQPVPRLLQLIENLKNPDVAGRVRILTIWLVAVQNAIRDAPNVAKKPHFFLKRIIKLLFRRKKLRRQALVNSQKQEKVIQDRYHSVEDAGKVLVGVENMNLHWHSPFDESLFDAIQPVFGSNLRTLYLDILIMTLAKACPFLTALEHLEEFELLLRTDSTHVVFKEHYEEAVASAIVPFINRLGSSLQVLSMTVQDQLELGSLFGGLGKFPQLSRLMLSIPFDLHHIDDPSGFNRLLTSHPRLRELYIKHRSWCPHQSPDTSTGSIWVQRCFQSVTFESLKTLTLGLSNAFHLRFVNDMAPLAQSLSSLILTEPNLLYDEVQSVLNSLTTPKLRSLTLSIETLTPQLLALLAEMRPELGQLKLSITQCRRAEGAQGPHDQEGFIRGLESDYVFRRQLYDAWRLRKLSILMWVYTLGRREQYTLVNAISAKVPALRKVGQPLQMVHGN